MLNSSNEGLALISDLVKYFFLALIVAVPGGSAHPRQKFNPAEWTIIRDNVGLDAIEHAPILRLVDINDIPPSLLPPEKEAISTRGATLNATKCARLGGEGGSGAAMIFFNGQEILVVNRRGKVTLVSPTGGRFAGALGKGGLGAAPGVPGVPGGGGLAGGGGMMAKPGMLAGPLPGGGGLAGGGGLLPGGGGGVPLPGGGGGLPPPGLIRRREDWEYEDGSLRQPWWPGGAGPVDSETQRKHYYPPSFQASPSRDRPLYGLHHQRFHFNSLPNNTYRSARNRTLPRRRGTTEAQTTVLPLVELTTIGLRPCCKQAPAIQSQGSRLRVKPRDKSSDNKAAQFAKQSIMSQIPKRPRFLRTTTSTTTTTTTTTTPLPTTTTRLPARVPVRADPKLPTYGNWIPPSGGGGGAFGVKPKLSFYRKPEVRSSNVDKRMDSTVNSTSYKQKLNAARPNGQLTKRSARLNQEQIRPFSKSRPSSFPSDPLKARADRHGKAQPRKLGAAKGQSVPQLNRPRPEGLKSGQQKSQTAKFPRVRTFQMNSSAIVFVDDDTIHIKPQARPPKRTKSDSLLPARQAHPNYAHIAKVSGGYFVARNLSHSVADTVSEESAERIPIDDHSGASTESSETADNSDFISVDEEVTDDEYAYYAEDVLKSDESEANSSNFSAITDKTSSKERKEKNELPERDELLAEANNTSTISEPPDDMMTTLLPLPFYNHSITAVESEFEDVIVVLQNGTSQENVMEDDIMTGSS